MNIYLAEDVQVIQEAIEKYNTLHLVFLIAGICFAVFALALFIVLNIPKVFMSLTGLSKKHEIKVMDDNAAYTTQLSRRLGRSDRKGRRRPKNVALTNSGRLAVQPGAVPVTQIKTDNTGVVTPEPNNETAVLSSEPAGSMETTVLSNKEPAYQTIPSPNVTMMVIKADSLEDLGFRVVQEILMVSTNEDILS